MRKRAALMSRVSSDEQAKGFSLGVQSEALENYCLRNDIEIVYTFKEDHSAKNFERPAFNTFLNHVKKSKGAIDVLLFTTWDRFSRNILDAYTMIDRLKRLGIIPHAIEQPIDPTIPENKAILAMFLVIPEIDNDRRSIKIRGGIRAALKAGRWCRMAPYGYRNTRDENNRPIIVPNQHAPHIRTAFEMVSKGITQPIAREYLNTNGVPIKKSRFSEMLKNPMYMGKIEVPALEDEPYQLIEGMHEGIVSEQLFFKVQQVLKGHAPKKRIAVAVRDEVLPLRGILRCSSCKGKLTGSRSRSRNGNRHAYYHCNHCGTERYRAERANDTVKEVLNGMTFSKPNAVLHQELVKRLLNGNELERKSKAVQLKATIAKQNERIERLQDNLADGVITSNDFTEMKNRFSELMRNALEELSSSQGDSAEKSALLKKAVSVISGLGDFYGNADSLAKVKLLGSIFPEMIEFDGNKCRTTKINEALALCLSIDAGFSETKNRTLPEKLEVSGWVEPTGVEPITFLNQLLTIQNP
ncbi:MAG: recombinase family protein [Flavobacteriales bacterium]|nr:recombinase family protein [Flavobacteriales bacterium]